MQEDLGDRQLFQVYEDESDEQCDEYKEQAIALIAKIQNATERAYETQSISSRLAFDEPKLSWELDFFFDHYFGSLRARHCGMPRSRSWLNSTTLPPSLQPCHACFAIATITLQT